MMKTLAVSTGKLHVEAAGICQISILLCSSPPSVNSLEGDETDETITYSCSKEGNEFFSELTEAETKWKT